jgi:hypothetical protein
MQAVTVGESLEGPVSEVVSPVSEENNLSINTL